MFILLFALAILMVLLSIGLQDVPYWNLMCIFLSIVLFMILAAGVYEIEVPYTAFNATSGQIEDGITSVYSETNIYLSYLFWMFAVIMFVYFIAMVFDAASEYMKR